MLFRELEDRIRQRYGLLEPSQHFEAVHLKDVQEISEGDMIIASASSRNGRFAQASSIPLTQCSIGGMQEELTMVMNHTDHHIPPSILSNILAYQEPRRQWQLDKNTQAHDNNLSGNKTRVALAALFLLHMVKQQTSAPSFSIIGRDYNVGSSRGEFMDKAGFIHYATTDKRVPSSWVFAETDQPPIEPVDQFSLLYHAPHQETPFFVTANSTTILQSTGHQINLEEITALLDFTQPLPHNFQMKTAYSFLALQTEEQGIDAVEALIGLYSSMMLGAGGEFLYAIPGLADWTRMPFRDFVQVWTPNGSLKQAVFSSFKEIQQSVKVKQGIWTPLSEVSASSDIENEIVGASTFSLRRLLTT